MKKLSPKGYEKLISLFRSLSGAIKRGMSVMDVQRILGHESLETTKIYLDLDDSNLQFQHQKFL